jgi:hypothetical protein
MIQEKGERGGESRSTYRPVTHQICSGKVKGYIEISKLKYQKIILGYSKRWSIYSHANILGLIGR